MPEPEEARATLARLLKLAEESSEDGALAAVQNDVEKLMQQAQDYIKQLDKQLAKLSTTTSQIAQELTRRVPASESNYTHDIEMKDEASPEDMAVETVEDPTTGEEHPTIGEKTVAGPSSPPSPQDKFVHNPKSEFVASQELPISALGLFEETPGDEGLKKKLGVASYPTKDLEDMLPGRYPDEDFTRAKPPSQVQASTFATFLEPYFRPFVEEDLGILEQKSVGNEVISYGRAISPYVVPPLGPLYTDVWAEEDAGHQINMTPAPRAFTNGQYQPQGAMYELSDEGLETGKVSAGPLTARLMAALLPEFGNDDETLPTNPPAVAEIPQMLDPHKQRGLESFGDLEDRLRREFRYVGIMDMNALRTDEQNRRQFKLASAMPIDLAADDDGELEIDWVNSAEDDEICRELRAMQAKLKDVSGKNTKYKRRLLPLVQEQMAWQEYTSILDDLDKQVEQAYLRRVRAPKSKKKKPASGAADSPHPAAVAPPPDAKPATRAALDKRARWINKIGSVFRSEQGMWRSHQDNKFDGDDDDDEEEEEEV